MIKIRRCVFETNSSSTHSISIYKWTPTEEKPVPINSTIAIDGEISSQTEIKDELGKLNYIVAILASIAEHRSDYNEDEMSFDELIKTNRFVWLKEVIKNKCNTDIVYKPTGKYFPYFETTYDENRGIEEILGCDIDNEEEFKARVAEIIFEPNYVIEDKENEY
jgi:hypothetical protein